MYLIARHLPLCLMLSYILTSVTFAQTSESDWRPIADDLSHWNTHAARKKLDKLRTQTPEDPLVLFHYAHLLYLEGRYKDSVEAYEKLPNDLLQASAPKRMYQQAMETEKTLRSFNDFQTSDGRFLIRYEGKDKLLKIY